jgi:squalene-associated FAD-dependent desaturase
MNKEENKKILIVGGGVAGCVSFWHGIKSGYDVILCESSSSLGGRLRSRNDKITGDEIDNGQHLLMGAYNVFLDFISDMGLSNSLDIQDKLRIPYILNGKIIKLEKKIGGQIGMLLAILSLGGLNKSDKISVTKMVIKIRLGILNYLGKTCGELFEKEKQNKNIVEILWEPIILATLNTKVSEASAELFVEVLRQIFLGKEFNSKMIIPKCSLANFFIPLESWAKENVISGRKGELKMNTTVKSLIFDGENCVGIKTAKGETIFADHVISTLPPDRISKLIKDDKVKELLNNFSFSPIISIYLWFDKDFLDEKILGLLNTKTQWLFSKKKNRAEDADFEKYPEFLTATISARDELVKMSSEDIVNICLEEICENIPKAKKSNLLHYKLIREKNATIIQNPKTDELRKLIMKINSNENNNELFLAGDWTWTGLPATIESAARSGRDAVEKIKNSQK